MKVYESLLNKKLKCEKSDEIAIYNEMIQYYDEKKTEAEIKEEIRCKLMKPIVPASEYDFLKKLFGAHKRKFEDLYSSTFYSLHNLNLNSLHSFYKTEFNVSISLEDFLNKINTREFTENVLKAYSFSNSGYQDFLKKFNQTLEKFNFKYRFVYKETIPSRDSELLVKCIQNNELLKPENIRFSSGERWILETIGWLFLIDPRLDSSNQANLILLDEPDKHLDKDLCKLFLDIIDHVFINNNRQVIMTTHRVDTVALAPQGSTFNVCFNEENKKYELKQVHRLQAVFKMTGNIREITSYHHKVYTESLGDASFYEAIYNSLKSYCQRIRKEIKKNAYSNSNLDYYWYINNKPFRILSQRCQMSFYTVSVEKKDGGGCREVIKAVKRDRNNKRRKNDELYIQNSYGVIDNDYNKDHGLGKQKVDEFIKIVARHSLENFLYDPFVVLSADVYDKLDKNLKPCYKRLQQALRNSNLGEVQKAIDEYFRCLIISPNESIDERWKNCFQEARKKVNEKSETDKVYSENIRAFNALINDLETKSLDSFQSYSDIDDFIDSLKEKHLKKVKFGTINQINQFVDLIKPTRIIEYRIVFEYKQDALYRLGYKEIDVLLDLEKTITVEYPNLFLNWRGHDINFSIRNNLSKDDFMDSLLDNLNSREQLMIPMDLAETFFSLNMIIINEIRLAIKKGPAAEPKKIKK